MKTIKSLFTVLLLAVSVALSAQIHNVSRLTFTHIDLVNYSSFCSEDIAGRVRIAISEGKLKAYKDKSLKNPLSIQEYYNLIEVKEHRRIPNPQNPDDIYDLIDTVIVYESWPLNFIFSEKEAVEIIYDTEVRIFITNESLKKVLDARLISMINYFNQKGLKNLSDTGFFTFFKQHVKELGISLYNNGTNGKLKPYQNDSLKSVYTADEITERVGIKEYKSIPNPQNPNDWNDLIDTVIFHEFNPESINKIRLYFEWETNKFESKAGFFAIGPVFKPIAAGLELSYTAIFLIKGGDYLATLNKTEKEFWTYFYSFMLQNTSSGNEYGMYSEELLNK